MSKYSGISIRRFERRDDVRLRMFPTSDDRRVRSKDWSVVVHVLHEDQHRLGDEVPLAQVTVGQGEDELVL